MDRRVGKNLIAQQFGNVGIHKELDIANQRIEELTAEIEELKASGNKQSEKEKVIELHSSLREQGISSIPLFEIEPNPEQPRQTFSEESILLLARSLEQDGQQQPILLFQKETRRYFLFDGERRWRAAQVIGWKKIDAVIIPQRQSSWIDKPETLRRQAILTNHHRENLNPLDLAEALVKEIATIHQNFQEDEVPLLLDAVIARLTRRKSLDIVTLLISANSQEQEIGLQKLEKEGAIKEKERLILQFLLSLQLNPASVKANVFPSLKLFEDLKKAIRKEGLGGHQARVLQRLSAKNLKQSEKDAKKIRQRLVKKVIEEKLSVAATRQQIEKEIAKYNEVEKSPLSKVAQTTIARIENVSVSKMSMTDLKALENSLKQKLKEIEWALTKEADLNQSGQNKQ